MFADLDQATDIILKAGLKISTQVTYQAMQAQFIKFCNKFYLQHLPASELTILRYMTFLSNKPGRYGSGMAASSIQLHLSAIRSLHVLNHCDVTYTGSPRVQLFLKSVARKQPAPIQKSPIDFPLLTAIWKLITDDYQGKMIKAALGLSFFATLRGCEFLLVHAYNGIVTHSPPTLDSIAFGVHQQQRYVTFTVTSSKTEPKGFTRFVGCSQVQICCPCSMWQYLTVRRHIAGSAPTSPLFIWEDGSVLDKVKFNQILKSYIKVLGLNPQHYSTHSLRAGAVSEGSGKLPSWLLAKMGGWKSNIFTQYVRNTGLQHIQVAAKLAK